MNVQEPGPIEFEARTLEIKPECIRCPRLYGIAEDFSNAARFVVKNLQEGSSGDILDAVIVMPQGIPLTEAIELDVEERAEQSAKMLGMIIEKTELAMDVMETAVINKTEDCPGACDLEFTTYDGELIEVTVCRSPENLAEDSGIEPVSAYVYRRPARDDGLTQLDFTPWMKHPPQE